MKHSLCAAIAISEVHAAKRMFVRVSISLCYEPGFISSTSVGMWSVHSIQDQKTQPGGGADALRLWVASVDYSNDVSVGPNVLAQTLESLRKVCACMFRLLFSD